MQSAEHMAIATLDPARCFTLRETFGNELPLEFLGLFDRDLEMVHVILEARSGIRCCRHRGHSFPA